MAPPRRALGAGCSAAPPGGALSPAPSPRSTAGASARRGRWSPHAPQAVAGCGRRRRGAAAVNRGKPASPPRRLTLPVALSVAPVAQKSENSVVVGARESRGEGGLVAGWA